MRYSENRAQLLTVVTIPAVDAAHAVRLAKELAHRHNGVSQIVNAADGRTLISHNELDSLEVSALSAK